MGSKDDEIVQKIVEVTGNSSSTEISKMQEDFKNGKVVSLQNSTGQSILLMSNQVVIMSGNSMIVLKDDGGMIVSSTSQVEMNAGENIEFEGTDIHLHATGKLLAKVMENTIQMDDTGMDIKSTGIKSFLNIDS